MKLFTAAQKNYLLFRKLEIGNVYMLPRFGFMAYTEPNTINSSYIDTNPFTKSLDYQPVELIALQDGFAKVKFIHSLKGKRPEFWIKSFDLEYRGSMETFILTVMIAIPFSLYNIVNYVRGKL